MSSVSKFRGNVTAIAGALSLPRFQTYLNEKGGDYCAAMDLYEWNAKTSNALFFAMHVCEVVIRNAVAEAIETVYGANWPYSAAFQQSLPNAKGGKVFNPRRELEKVARTHPNAPGKVIADLKFIFWETMFTYRFDVQIWHKNLLKVLPNATSSLGLQTPSEVRSHIHTSLNNIRAVRNRIAHHEPIFSRNLQAVLNASKELVLCRCASTHQWLVSSEQATTYIQNPA